MSESQTLADTVRGIARMCQRPDSTEILDALAGCVSFVLDVAGAAVWGVCDGELRLVTATSPGIEDPGRLQERDRTGPGGDAVRSGVPVLVPELAAQAGRWPRYARRAAEVGVTAVAAIPVRSGPIGCVDLYHDRAHPWSDDSVHTAQVLADIAISHARSVSELERYRRTSAQLQQALDSRVVIEQAKGLIAAHREVTMDEAFQILRRHARDHNAKLRAVASAVINLGLRL
ncbi:MAG TPA: GAF and ANTAR domain-containing protein [Mycobacterium sp.]|nr:GAF and ANTAR domain-containing protein [Mycobacterium sp.]